MNSNDSILDVSVDKAIRLHDSLYSDRANPEYWIYCECGFRYFSDDRETGYLRCHNCREWVDVKKAPRTMDWKKWEKEFRGVN